MPARCPRAWEVEALRDGRVGDNARADLERHMARCPSCGEERVALDDLARRLRADVTDEPDDLALRRLRGRVLEGADSARLVPSQRPSAMRSPAVRSLVFAVALCASFALAWRVVRTEPQTQVTTTDEGGARWSTYDEGALRRIDLLEGTLALRIDRPASGKRVVVRVPDGEIEDTGTTFRVTVRDGHTNAVEVDEGSVVVRLEGRPPTTLSAGARWTRDPAPIAQPAVAPSPTSVVSETPVASATPPARSAATRMASSSSSSSPPTASSRPAAQADDGEEDRAYVEIVRLLREKREADATAAARDYVRRFPNGFRRTEVDRVLAGH